MEVSNNFTMARCPTRLVANLARDGTQTHHIVTSTKTQKCLWMDICLRISVVLHWKNLNTRPGVTQLILTLGGSTVIYKTVVSSCTFFLLSFYISTVTPSCLSLD